MMYLYSLGWGSYDDHATYDLWHEELYTKEQWLAFIAEGYQLAVADLLTKDYHFANKEIMEFVTGWLEREKGFKTIGAQETYYINELNMLWLGYGKINFREERRKEDIESDPLIAPYWSQIMAHNRKLEAQEMREYKLKKREAKHD